jgi:hypothetical protein
MTEAAQRCIHFIIKDAIAMFGFGPKRMAYASWRQVTLRG